jgi:hypothetical protein
MAGTFLAPSKQVLRKHTFTGSIEVGKLTTERTIRVFATRLKLPEYGGAIRRN